MVADGITARQNSTYYEGDLRSDLLKAALVVIDENGVNAVSLRDLARRVGVSHAAPAHHFSDKAGLFTALAVQAFEEFADHLDASVDHVDDVAELVPDGSALLQLAAKGMAYVEYATQNKASFEVMFRSDIVNVDVDEYRRAADRALGVMANALRAAQLQGWAADSDPDDMVLLLWSLVHGLSTLSNHGLLESVFGQADVSDVALRMLGELGNAYTPPAPPIDVSITPVQRGNA